MREFIATARPNNIFYGDIFKIHDQGCLIFGSGKSQASRIASNSLVNEDAEVGLDFACLTREDNQLYGHYEFEIRAPHIEDPIHERVKLDYFIRMLDEKETAKVFQNKELRIINVGYAEFVQLSTFNITFVAPSLIPKPPGFPETETNHRKRMEKFINLTNGTDIAGFLLVPWTERVEGKAEMIEKYILENLKR
ncbi:MULTISPECIES: hypothetical protein [unclassified Bacillus (in: firmicutes)]|uniref:hypothetical protein n=1 Tax=unclassified Bacillus (in: firmicutes) TaxID=185979 RepID=UPI000E35E3A2|nr:MULTISPECIES: hypothetical protein [unclassified Bacillus (in: firmicutes)]AXR16913.1 hypothetical protein DOS87_12605 [Bacillus sp. CR71]AXR22608.1 hypothetical protein DPQ26_12370 [Bacillus sp. E25]